MISVSDKEYIESRGLSIEDINSQILRFKKGFDTIEVVSPATLNDGILDVVNKEKYVQLYDQTLCEIVKFVPASGKATRMFAPLKSFEVDPAMTEDILSFFENIEKYPFFEALNRCYQRKNGKSITAAESPSTQQEIVRLLLSKEGLAFEELPKGLVPFHRAKNTAITPIEEHLKEGQRYAKKNHRIYEHFTVSKDHQQAFEEKVNSFTKNTQDVFDVTYSVQRPSTDVIALTAEDKLFRDEKGEILFRPSGHGALLENLNAIEADLIFIKNIDNVQMERLVDVVTYNKKFLAGILLHYQSETFRLLRRHHQGENIIREGKELLQKLGLKQPSENEVVQKLDRPIRVCGMVKNENNPGGGPFWVKENGNDTTLQIIESAQLNAKDIKQREIFNQSTHFNPVDLVCGVRNYQGKKFNLGNFTNPHLGFITEKTHQHHTLKVMELPGLWNGSMADWNTLFVEVPSETFSPVKTVFDLVKPTHL